MQARHAEWLEQMEISLLAFDDDIKQMVKRPVMLNTTFQPGLSHLKVESTEDGKNSDKRHVTVLP